MRALAVLCGALAAVFGGAAAAAASPLAITHVTVIDTTGGPPKSDMTVIVQDRRIVDLGGSDTVHVPAGARVWVTGRSEAKLTSRSPLPAMARRQTPTARLNGSVGASFVVLFGLIFEVMALSLSPAGRGDC